MKIHHYTVTKREKYINSPELLLDMEPIKASISYYVREPRDIDGLSRLKDYPIHLSLRHGYESFIRDVGQKIVDEQLEISSIHAPKFQPEKGVGQFKDLTTILGAKSFTIHSDRRPLGSVVDAWLPVLENLYESGISVSFENSRKTGDWLEDPYNIPEHPLFNLTLDFNHIPAKYDDELKVLKDLAAKVKLVHVVDRRETGPYSRFQELIPIAGELLPKTEFVLEYGRNNMDFMLADYKAIMVENKRIAQEKYRRITTTQDVSLSPNQDDAKIL
jgi:hypothetical protein